MKKTVYQTDPSGLYLYEIEANELPLSRGLFNIPYGAHEMKPPNAPAGKVPRWTGQGWGLVDDYRTVPLWIKNTGQAYGIGTVIATDDGVMSYPGWGQLPAWLSTQQPTFPHETA